MASTFHRPKKNRTAKSSKWKKAFDNLVFLMALVSVVMTVPQALQIWGEKNAAGISVASWTTYTVGAVFWMLYGFVHRENAMIYIYGLFTLINASVVVGALVYG